VEDLWWMCCSGVWYLNTAGSIPAAATTGAVSAANGIDASTLAVSADDPEALL